MHSSPVTSLLTCTLGVLFVSHYADACSSREVECDTGDQCIPLKWRCDGVKDCYDQSDEENCVIEYCKSDPCSNGGTCFEIPSGYRCHCESGYKRADCQRDYCERDPCQNGGSCFEIPSGYRCHCVTGYNGTHCETVLDHCQSDPCRNSGSCYRTGYGYTCRCAAGYRGSHCETPVDYCESDPCGYRGSCYSNDLGYRCRCYNGYTGPQCQTVIEYCASDPCMNGASCQSGSSAYTCHCVVGYIGSHCETVTNPCYSRPCQHRGTCRRQGNRYKCICKAGFTGSRCETARPPCDSDPCRNGGICNQRGNTFTCACKQRYTGIYCEARLTGGTDLCNTNPCPSGYTCRSFGSSRVCEYFRFGFSWGACRSDPCRNGGSCYPDDERGYLCSCASGFGGDNCDTVTNACSSNPCYRGYTCTVLGSGGYTCHCESKVSAKKCQLGDCGILGGPISRVVPFPWQVTIEFNGVPRCSGTLVQNRMILTDGICRDQLSPNPMRNARVILGSGTRSLETNTLGTIRLTARNGLVLIGFLQLLESVSTTSTIRSVCLPTVDWPDAAIVECYFTSWGSDLSLRKMKILNMNRCQSGLSTASMSMCVEETDGGGRVCYGKYGGPLLCKDSADVWTMRGYIFVGSPKCFTGPHIYTNLKSFLPHIPI